jgi:hypothetical protein
MIVAGHHHLLAHRLDGVEGVQEFLLRRLLAAQEMHVVDDQKIQIAHLAGGRRPVCWSAGRLEIRW